MIKLTYTYGWQSYRSCEFIIMFPTGLEVTIINAKK